MTTRVFEDPQVLARDMVVEVGSPAGPVRLVGSPVKGLGGGPSGPVPGLGEHTREVLDAARLGAPRPAAGEGEGTR